MTDAKSLFHCCSSAYLFIDHLIDIGVDVLNPVQVTAKNLEPERLKGEFGDRMSPQFLPDFRKEKPDHPPRTHIHSDVLVHQFFGGKVLLRRLDLWRWQ